MLTTNQGYGPIDQANGAQVIEVLQLQAMTLQMSSIWTENQICFSALELWT